MRPMLRTVRIAMLATGFLGACGPVSSESDESGADAETVESSADTTQAATASTTSTTSQPSTTSAGPLDTGDPSDAGSGTADPASSTSADTSETGAGACAEDGYRGALIIGGIDRVRIFRRDDAAKTCTWLTLAALPGGESPYDVDATTPWVLESAAWNDAPESCETNFPAESGEVLVPDAWGTIDLQPPAPALPCLADVDVQLQLLENPDPPVFIELCHTMITLDGC
jgi:hypothetical protein